MSSRVTIVAILLRIEDSMTVSRQSLSHYRNETGHQNRSVRELGFDQVRRIRKTNQYVLELLSHDH